VNSCRKMGQSSFVDRLPPNSIIHMGSTNLIFFIEDKIIVNLELTSKNIIYLSMTHLTYDKFVSKEINESIYNPKSFIIIDNEILLLKRKLERIINNNSYKGELY